MVGLILSLSLSVLNPAQADVAFAPSPAEVVPHHVSHPHRSKSVIQQFKRGWSWEHKGLPCPETCATYVKRGGKYVLYYRCTACQVDHPCALACGGLDSVENLRWMDAKANNAKSDDCSLCGSGKK